MAIVKCAVLLWCSVAAAAPVEPRYDFDIPAQNLAQSLEQLAEQSGALTLFPFDVVSSVRANPIRGRYTLAQALEAMLKGTGLSGDVTEKRVINIKPSVASRRNGQGETMIEHRKKKHGRLLGWLTTVLAASSAHGQDAAAGGELEEIVVTGFRQSLQDAQNIKREAAQVVDSVVAEDIGKLPDNNVPEALQRIPGIQITRNRGEGSSIAVRGLTQVKTLLNGREIYSDNGRDLSLENVPAEILGGVDVYKNPSASLIEGGLGGVINLKTRQPFDFDEFTASFSARANEYDFIDDIKPQISGLVANRWNAGEGEIGVLLSVAYLESAARQDQIGIEPYADRYDIEDFDGDGFFPGDGSDPGDRVLSPRGGGNIIDLSERERLAINGMLQWQVNDELELFAEGTYNTYDFTQNDYVKFANRGPLQRLPGEVFTYYPGTNVVRTGAYQNVQFTSNTHAFDREAETWQLATGGTWNATDRLTFRTDISYTESERDDRNGNLRIGNIANTAGTTLYFDTEGDVPSLLLTGFDFDNPALYSFINADHNKEHAGGTGITGQLDGTLTFENDFVDGIAFGVRYASRDVERQQGAQNHLTGNPSGLLLPEAVIPIPHGDFFRGTGRPQLTGQFNPPPSLARDIERQCEVFGDAVCYPAFNPINSYEQSETTQAVFSQLNFAFDVGNFPVDGNIGARYVWTDLSVDGFRTSNLGVSAPINQDNSYSDLLPSLNVRVTVLDDLYVRMAAAKQLTRPTFGDLSPSLNLGTQSVIGLVGRAGNPDLKPLESNSYDLGVEWYFSDDGYAYAAGFLKEVDGFIQTVTRVEPVNLPDYPGYTTAEITRPQNGEDGRIKGFEVGGQTFFDFLPDPFKGFGVQANYTYVDSSAPGPIEGTSVPLVGLSKNSYNAIAFYERNGFRARLAYTWRNDYVETTAGPGSGSLPIYARPFGMLDASIGYSINENIDISLDASNLTHEVQKTYFGEEIRRRYYTVYDRRVGLVFRVKL